MIADLNETIKQLLVEGVPLDLSEIDVVFEQPDSEWSSSLSRPTINCYLYHVVENHDLRRADWRVITPEQSENGQLQRGQHRTVTKRRLPFRMDHHYFITAWANEIEDEHRLLWRILSALMRYTNGNLPPEKLQGELFGLEMPVPVKVAQPESPIKNPTDFWSSMEIAIKPSVNMVLTVPLDPDMAVIVPLVLTRRVLIHPEMDDRDENKAELPGLQFGGWVWSAAGDDARPVAGSEVVLVERNLKTTSDSDGRFRFDYVPYGRYTLRATADGEQAERQIELPGEDYDLTLGVTAAKQLESASEAKAASTKRDTGTGRRR